MYPLDHHTQCCNGFPSKVLEKILENDVYFIGSNGKQAAMVYHPVCVENS